jgi:hypothetical protein
MTTRTGRGAHRENFFENAALGIAVLRRSRISMPHSTFSHCYQPAKPQNRLIDDAPISIAMQKSLAIELRTA